jgi:phasin family protein
MQLCNRGESPFFGTEKMKSAEQMMSFSQGNLEAMVKSSQIVAAGLQDLSKQMAANAQAAVDESMSTLRALAGIRSMKDAFEMQANFARTSVEKVMSQTGHLTEASFKLAGEAYEPIAHRMTIAVDSFKAA